MPKRVVDGDALWVSEKLVEVGEEFRAEYAWILPLSQNNGCFECSPLLVWRSCYAALRPSWSMDKVKSMLESFEQAKMLFRFKRAGKTYGFFPGSQKDGRLPKSSDRIKSAKEWRSGMVPLEELAEFLGLSVAEVKAEYGSRDLLAESSRGTRGVVATSSRNTRAHDNDDEHDDDYGHDDENHYEYVHDVGDADATYESNIKAQSRTSSPLPRSSNRIVPPPSPRVPREDIAEDPVAPFRFADMWHILTFANPHVDSSKIPVNWYDLWSKDFRELLASYTAEELRQMIAYTQLPDQQQYNIRPEGFKKNAARVAEFTQHLMKNKANWNKAVSCFEANLALGQAEREKLGANGEDDEDADAPSRSDFSHSFGSSPVPPRRVFVEDDDDELA